MKQNEENWVEFENSMEDVITRSVLDKSILFDIRGNLLGDPDNEQL